MELELVCSKQPFVHDDGPTDPYDVACHSNQLGLHRSKELELHRSMVQELVLVHSKELVLAHSKELELVRSKQEHRHIGCAVWHANVPTNQHALERMLVRRSKLELDRSMVLELVLHSMLQVLVHSNRFCDGTNQPKLKTKKERQWKQRPKQSMHDAFKSLPKQ